MDGAAYSTFLVGMVNADDDGPGWCRAHRSSTGPGSAKTCSGPGPILYDESLSVHRRQHVLVCLFSAPVLY